MWEIVEYASILFKFVWAIATKLPKPIDNNATTINISCHTPISGSRLVASNRKTMTKAAIFGALAK